MKNSFASLVENSKSILILLPLSPQFDHVAAGLGLYLALNGVKEASIACSSPMVVEFNRLVGVNKIGTSLGDKNLTIKFVNYDANAVDRVSADIENGEFKLTVIPKPGISSPKKDQLDLVYSGVSADMAVLVGGEHEGHFPVLSGKEIQPQKIIHIGIREINLSQSFRVLSFARPASSISEIIASLIKESGFNLDADVATNLFMGIEEGSKRFTHPMVNSETFEILAHLMKLGGRRVNLPQFQPAHFPPGSIPGEVPLEPEKKENASREVKEESPKDWSRPPKIYTGTGGIPIS